MSFQDKVIESAAELRARALALAQAAIANPRSRTTQASDGGVAQIRNSLAALQVAGRQFNKVASRHLARFVKQNSTLARDAGKDVSALARSTFLQLSKRETTAAPKARKAGSRKRAASTTRSRARAKAA